MTCLYPYLESLSEIREWITLDFDNSLYSARVLSVRTDHQNQQPKRPTENNQHLWVSGRSGRAQDAMIF